MKTNNDDNNIDNPKEVIWENTSRYFINNEETDHTTWLNSILSGPRTAYQILETEKTGKNVLEVKNKELLEQVKFKVKKDVMKEVHCLNCRSEFKTGSYVYLCSTCGCLYCEECAGKILFFRTKKTEEGTYCSNCF